MILIVTKDIDYRENCLYLEKLNKNIEINQDFKNIVFYFDNSLILSEIIYNNNKIIKVKENKKFYLKKELNKYFKKLNLIKIIDENFLRKLLIYNQSLPLETSYLLIKLFKNSFIRFIYINPNKKIYKENNLSLEEWNNWENEFITLKKELDFHIKSKNKQELDRIFQIIRDNIKKFILKLEIPLINDNYYRKLNIIYNSGNFYIPFEFFDDKLFVHYLVLSKNRSYNINYNDVKIYYSKELTNSLGESYSIIKMLENLYKIELIPLEEIYTNLSELIFSGTIHIISHGIIEEENGYLVLGNNKIDKLPLSGNHELIFLNCCNIGFSFEGIIENLLKNNSRYVIASPFEIEDSNEGNEFYFYFNPEFIEISYHMSCINNNNFQKYYKIFEQYYEKI